MSTSSSSVESRLASLGIELPAPAKPVAAYIPARRAGNLLFISGQLPFIPNTETGKPTLMHTGTVPGAVSVEEAIVCARRCVINGLAAARAEMGSLDNIKGVVRVGVWVASEPGFTEHPRVANGASELLVEVFGDAGRHARAAVGSVSLPLGTPVEVEFLFEVG